MNLIAYNDCQKSLDFQPDTIWPKYWPAFAWENKLVSGFNNKNQVVLNFTSEDVNFLYLFHHCHPQLSLSEMGRILLRWNKTKKPVFSWKEFFSLYKLSQNTDFLIQQLKIFMSTPHSFQNWVNKKKLHPAELRVLNSIKNTKPIHFILEWIAGQNLSHALGMKALELSTELFLMGYQTDKILNPNISPEEAILEMEKKRKPFSFSLDQTKKKHLKTTWPSHVTARWHRKGDQAGLEIKMWCRNQEDLEKKLIGVKSAFQQLK